MVLLHSRLSSIELAAESLGFLENERKLDKWRTKEEALPNIEIHKPFLPYILYFIT